MKPDYGGIDFGTSNSTAAVFTQGGPRLVALEEQHVTMPSAVFFNFENDRTYFGRLAIEEYTANTEGRLLRALKSILGTSLFREKTRLKGHSIAFTRTVNSVEGRASTGPMALASHFVAADPCHRRLDQLSRRARIIDN